MSIFCISVVITYLVYRRGKFGNTNLPSFPLKDVDGIGHILLTPSTQIFFLHPPLTKKKKTKKKNNNNKKKNKNKKRRRKKKNNDDWRKQEEEKKK